MIPLLLFLQVAAADTGRPAFEREVVLTPEVREYLARQWDEVRPFQRERGYCLVAGPAPGGHDPADTVAVVVAAVRAVALSASPATVQFSCGPRLVELHVHTPTTCAGPDDCRLGGPGAFLCFPSDTDIRSLRASGKPLALLQCSRYGVVVYYPEPGSGGVP